MTVVVFVWTPAPAHPFPTCVCVCRMFILPPLAGGGTCSSYQVRTTLGCTAANGCYSFYRTTNVTFWLQALAGNLGFTVAVADLNNDLVPDAAGDQSDPSVPTALPWKRFNAPYRQALGWIPSSLVSALGSLTSVTLSSSSTVAAPAGPNPVQVIRIVGSTNVWFISMRTADPASFDAGLLPGEWRRRWRRWRWWRLWTYFLFRAGDAGKAAPRSQLL